MIRGASRILQAGRCRFGVAFPEFGVQNCTNGKCTILHLQSEIRNLSGLKAYARFGGQSEISDFGLEMQDRAFSVRAILYARRRGLAGGPAIATSTRAMQGSTRESCC